MPCDNTNKYNKDDFLLVSENVNGDCRGCYFDSIGECYPSYFPCCNNRIYVLKKESCDRPVAMPIIGNKENVNVPELQSTSDTQHDSVNKPKHYMLFPENGIEVRDLMKVLADQLDMEYYNGMLVSDYIQMMQYLLRWHKKNGLEDLEKAQWYLSKIIEQVKGN